MKSKKTKVHSEEPATVDPYTPPQPEPSPAVTRQLSFASSVCETPAKLDDGEVKNLVATVSESATRKRMERLMQPKADGSFKIPEELIQEWRKGDQARLLQEFKHAGLDKDPYSTCMHTKHLVFEYH